MTKKSTIYIFLSVAFLSILWSICAFSGDGRIDVYWAEGKPENRFENVHIRHASAIYPDWCKKENGQCAVFKLKSVHLYPQKRKINFKVIGDGKIKIALRGMDHRRPDGKGLIPVYNDYSYLKVNGQKVTNGEKSLRKVWHNKPYFKEISVKNGETVTLKTRLKFHPGNAEYKKLALDFILKFILLTLLFLGIQRFFREKEKRQNLLKKICELNLLKKICDFMNRNWIEEIVNGYKSIDPVYRKSFWILFVLINIVFCFHTVTFMWGNHDWGLISNKQRFFTEAYMGRYSGYLIKGLLLDGRYLPVISNLLGFVGLALTSVLLCVYWNVKKTVPVFVLCGLVLSIQPFTLEWMYYVSAFPEFYVMPAFIIIGFILADKSVGIVSVWKKIGLNLISIAFMNFGLATYPSFLNILAIVFTGSILVNLLKEQPLKQIAKKKSAALIDIVLACLSYKAVLIYLEKAKILRSTMYTIQSLPLKDIPLRIVECFKVAIEQLYAYAFPFMPNSITLIFTVLLGLAVMSILCGKKDIRSKILILIVLFGALLTTKSAVMIAASKIFFVPRIDLFGLVYFRVLIVVILFESTQIIKNITILLTSIALWISAVNDFYALRTWKLGFEAEKMKWNRMLYRLETQKEFDLNKRYTFIQIGFFEDARKKFVEPNAKLKQANGLLGHTYDPVWIPFLAPKTLDSGSLKMHHLSSIHSVNNPSYINGINELYSAGVLQKAQEWPKENSLIVYRNYILLVAGKKELEKILKEMEDKNKRCLSVPCEKKE